MASTGSERLFCARGSSVGRFERIRGTARALDHPRMSRDLPLTHRGGQFSLPASVTLPGRGNRGLGRTSMMVSGLRPAMPVPRTGSMQASGLTLRGMTILSCVAIRVSRRAVEMWWRSYHILQGAGYVGRSERQEKISKPSCVCVMSTVRKNTKLQISQQNEKERSLKTCALPSWNCHLG